MPRGSRKKKLYSDDSDSLGTSAGRRRYERHSVEFEAMKAGEGSKEVESRKRRERRKRQWARETERQQREQRGLKGQYLSVSYQGIPYGFGVGAWRQELNKLCAALDPSVTNIRYQTEESMATLRQRLKENFEYSAPVDREYIRKLAGKSVTQRRSRLITTMNAGGSKPTGMNDDVWHRLDCIRKDPGREYLSQRMKHANALRINKGWTGPKGEEGITDDLYKALGRNPNPEEVQREMRRNKGYGGVSQKRRQAREIQVSSTSDDGKDGVKEGSEEDVWGV